MTNATAQPILSYAADRSIRLNPYPAFNQLREEAPLYHDPVEDIFYVSRHADLVTVFRNAGLSYDPQNSRRIQQQMAAHNDGGEATRTHLMRFHHMVEMDPPEHTRVRLLIGQAFTPQVVASLEPFITGLVDDLFDRFGSHGERDFVSDFAFLLPVFVICHLLGVPTDERDHFSDLVQAHLAVHVPYVDVEAKIAPQGRLLDYVEALIALKRRTPGADVLTILIEATDNGDRLSDQELVANATALLAAGFETTQNLLSNTVLQLLRHPDQTELIRRNPALVGPAVEEVLRFDPPTPTVRPRSIIADIELSTGTLHAGDAFMPMLAAANRDPAVYADPDRFDVTRSPNHHLSFGHGPHYCIGRTLARMEAKVTMASMLRRFAKVELTIDETELEYRPIILLRNLLSLPISY